jgi:two-component system OmpR family sensor kinase
VTTPTPSLRRRVVVTVLGLFALLLVLVGVLVDLAVDAQLGRDLDARLADRIAAAQRLAASGTAAPRLVPLLQGQDIRVRVVAPDGTGYGDPGLDTGGPDVPGPPPVDPRRPGPAPSRPGGGAAPPPAPPTPPDATSTVVTGPCPTGRG